LPLRWFADSAPVLNGVLSGLASAWTVIWSNLQFTVSQTRIATAMGSWLDTIAQDFFAGRLLRMGSETDAAFRTRILAELFRIRGTRAALSAMMTQLCGTTPYIFEPTNIRDTGGYGSAGSSCALFYNTAGGGGYGNVSLIMQALATAPTSGSLPQAETMASIAGVMPCTGIAWVDLA
jgi:hypothetical protein